MRVEVTDADIREAKAGRVGCPLAAAVRRTAGTQAVVVGFRSVRVGGTTAALPAAARRFVRAFDAGTSVEAAVFDLELSTGEVTCDSK